MRVEVWTKYPKATVWIPDAEWESLDQIQDFLRGIVADHFEFRAQVVKTDSLNRRFLRRKIGDFRGYNVDR